MLDSSEIQRMSVTETRVRLRPEASWKLMILKLDKVKIRIFHNECS